MDKIVFATNNEHKLREIRAILHDETEVLSLSDIGCHTDIPETADTLEGNALIKAHYVYDNYGYDCFADDTGLEVEALNGEPGVRTARYAGDNQDSQANMRKLLREMKGKDNRNARFRTAIALILDGEEHLFSGEVRGTITTEPIGDKGFGYDPVFIPEDTGKTFAQLGEDVKNHISHRARAVAKLTEFLNK
ncbi:MAG: non-canonical purine NTP diphosphatase [Bacteroidaceae bacterium]|nr:non-canonical purine NTP diphosphatase [Bacteroidaceae bacterium]